MSEPTVSAVIPAYNAAPFIRKAIDSVLSQTARVDEIIVVDDGSTDETCAVVESYGSPVRLLRQKNQGPAAARNNGVEAATSEFIAFLDADDSWENRKIELQMEAFAKAPKALLCYTGIRRISEDGTEQVHSVIAPEKLGSIIRVRMPGIPPSCAMIRRSTYLRAGGFNPALGGIEDWEFVLRLFRAGPFCAVDLPLLRYRVSTTGVSSNADRIYDEVVQMLEPVLLVGLHGLRRWVWRRRILSFQAYKAALTSRTTGNARELRYILESLLFWPLPSWHPVRYKAAAASLVSAFRARREPARNLT